MYMYMFMYMYMWHFQVEIGSLWDHEYKARTNVTTVPLVTHIQLESVTYVYVYVYVYVWMCNIPWCFALLSRWKTECNMLLLFHILIFHTDHYKNIQDGDSDSTIVTSSGHVTTWEALNTRWKCHTY